jgi:RNA polymerase sigma-70 factor (ECF subfamily)
VVQEAYIRASERIGQLRDPDQFETWVLRIALNRAKSVLRTERQARDKAPLLDPVGGRGSDLGLRELTEGLPARQRAVLVLHYGHGYRWAEVSRLLGLTTINVRTLAFRARRTLRRQLQEAEDA